MSKIERVWQSSEIRFDSPSNNIRLRKGEEMMDFLEHVEDTKGNNGERGSLMVTNLRFVWQHEKHSRINLSIGLGCVVSISIHKVDSKLLGHTQALFVMTKFGESRFEFIFTYLVRGSPRLFSTCQAVHRAFETSRMFRDVKLRGAIIRDKKLILLPGEHVYDQVNGVWNLAADQGNLGVFFVTNVRVVWFCQLAENFNVSVPYMQIKSLTTRPSKFGQALVITTEASAGGFVLGFRIDPAEKLAEVHKEIASLFEVFANNPNFGVSLALEDRPKSLEEVKVARKADDLEIVGDSGSVDSFAAYYSGAVGGGDRGDPVYSPELGLAIEKLQSGITIDSLWKIPPV